MKKILIVIVFVWIAFIIPAVMTAWLIEELNAFYGWNLSYHLLWQIPVALFLFDFLWGIGKIWKQAHKEQEYIIEWNEVQENLPPDAYKNDPGRFTPQWSLAINDKGRAEMYPVPKPLMDVPTVRELFLEGLKGVGNAYRRYVK